MWDDNKQPTSFKWFLNVIYNCPINSEPDEKLFNQDYLSFYYDLKTSTDNAHYSAIWPKDKKKICLPPDTKTYKY